MSTSIITDPTADPHQYESDAHDGRVVADGRRRDRERRSATTTSSPSCCRPPRSTGGWCCRWRDLLNATGADVNPHLWYDLPRFPTVAAAIESALAAADPADAAQFAANLKTLRRVARAVESRS